MSQYMFAKLTEDLDTPGTATAHRMSMRQSEANTDHYELYETESEVVVVDPNIGTAPVPKSRIPEALTPVEAGNIVSCFKWKGKWIVDGITLGQCG
ncbi:hypothetical protein Pan216_20790 [Planctomycetes bacterium Pan216]|uniref:Uncharacterized protein n=1 Tax=Kolteria novifilia TaxID=2527975 RepID=A0A518B2N0_9BACT|nr:hypothetical protein Pan216_20790 [Planctomycetes bacterium Pan216]